MRKPIIFANAIFIGWVLGTLAASYFKGREPEWFVELSAAAGMAFMAYVVTQWMQKKANSSPESSDS